MNLTFLFRKKNNQFAPSMIKCDNLLAYMVSVLQLEDDESLHQLDLFSMGYNQALAYLSYGNNSPSLESLG